MSHATPSGGALPLAKSRRWLIAISVALGALLEIVDISIVNVALTEMQASLGATLGEIGWVVTGYAIANVIILPLSAWLGDRFGKKRFFVFSLVAFVAASLLCGFAHSLGMLIVARVLQGLFGGGLLAKAQSILFETFPKEEQAAAQALFGVVAIAGPAIGPTLGGYIVTNLDWRWIFFINLPLGILAVLMASAFLVPDGERHEPAAGVDWFSLLLLALGLGSLQTVLEEGYSESWFDSQFICLMGALAAVCLVVFVTRQLRIRNPVVDLHVLRHRSLWAGCMVSAVIGMGLYGALFAVPIFAQSMLHFTAQQTGMLLLPGALASAFTMPFVARLLHRFDARLLIACGALLIIYSMHLLSNLNPQTSSDDLFWPLIIRGVGAVLMFLPMSMAALGNVPVREIASATGMYNLTRQLGGSIGIAILTTLLASREAFHRSVLVEKLGVSDLTTLERLHALIAGFVARGIDPAEARNKALALLDAAVNAQAAVISFGDTFWIIAAVFVCTLPLLLLLGKGRPSASAAASH
ncbi:MAG TPA: DHA2 family efflux MFS transporter permease subunit [Polyangiaceae bacterium]|nr:DHA2 family efflux MFS transporter permease subunit [Polyangiaceae bacterium]